MVLDVIHKLTPPFHRLSCNALIQSLFDYASTAWFSNLSKTLKQNRTCFRICLQLDKRSKIRVKKLLQLNWQNFHYRYLKFIISDSFKFQNDQRSDYFYELFCPVSQTSVITHSSNKKTKATFSKNKISNPKLIICGP